MEFDEIIKKRHSARSFKSKKVNFRHILDAIDSALQGPTAGGIANMKFIIIENKEAIKKISSFAEQTWINEAPSLICVISDDSILEEMYGERGRVFNRQQSGAAIMNILLKLTDHGLSSCWVGSYADELIKQYLKIPQHMQIECLIPVGYEEKTLSSKARKTNLENALFWEEFGTQLRPTMFKEAPLHKDPWK
jgi:nitroreductase